MRGSIECQRQIQRVNAGGFQRNAHRGVVLGQPAKQRLVTAGVVGKLTLVDGMIQLDQGHGQRTGADIDATKQGGWVIGIGLVHRPSPELRWSRLPPRPTLTDCLFAPTLNMQAPKAFDSPRRANRGAVADLRDRLNYNWPKEGTALPPKRESILTPLNATYKEGFLLLLFVKGRRCGQDTGPLEG